MNFFSLGSTVQHRFNVSTVASCGSLTRYLQLRNVTGCNIFLFLRDESALKEAWLSVGHCSWGGWFFQDLRSLSSHGNGSIYICCFYYILCITILLSFITSSTAQGGGGNFKNRKPIGEVGCCESWMAERIHWWIERWLMSPLFLSLFLSFSDYLPT